MELSHIYHLNHFQVLSSEGNAYTLIKEDPSAPNTLVSPLDSCLTPGERSRYLAVTDGNKVQFINYKQETLVDYLGFEVGTELQSVCFTADKQIVLSDITSLPAVYIFNTSGKLQTSLEPPAPGFSKPYHITSDKKYTKIYVSDNGAKCVFMFDKKGE